MQFNNLLIITIRGFGEPLPAFYFGSMMMAQAGLISNYLADQDRYVRLEAIAAIQYDFGPAFLPALENRIQHEKDSRVKGALAKAIAYLTNVAANDLEPYGDLTTPSTGARDRDELNWYRY